MGNRKTGAADQAGHAPAPEGGDNNTRLAFLEAGVSTLAIALATAGIELKEGQDPIEQAIAVTDRWRELTLQRAEIATVLIALNPELKEEDHDFLAIAKIVLEKYGDLGRQIGELAEYLAANHPEAIDGSAGACGTAVKVLTALDAGAKAAAGDGSEGEGASSADRIAALEAENVELKTDVEEAINARNALANELAALKDGRPIEAAPPATEPEPEPAGPRERPEAARDVGPTFGNSSVLELADLLTAGEDFEIAFSNGEFEIVEFGPNLVERGDLVFRGNQYHVEPAIYVNGAPQREAIAGAALLIGGGQVAYTTFDPPIVVDPGSEHKLHRAIVFG